MNELDNKLDVELLLSRLTPSEEAVIKLYYGLTGCGRFNCRRIAGLMHKSPEWVEARLSAAKSKMRLAVGR